MTRLTALQLNQLIANLNPARVASRSASGGGGSKLSYLEAWDVRAALTRIFGFGGYSYEGHSEVVHFETEVPRSKGGTQFRATVMATVKLTIPALGAYWQESAVSSQSNPDPGEALDFATKTAESDAFKRAAVNLGSQFGLSLYNNGATLDVIKVVREPYQAAVLKRLAAGEKPSAIDAEMNPRAVGVDVAEPDDKDRDFSNSEEGTQEVFGATVPGEDPRDDEAPMALASPESKAAAMSTVRDGFNRGRA
jgi:hypothetical protein